MTKRPLDLLHLALNQPVLVALRGGREYRGLLDGYDHPHLNLVLKDAEELRPDGSGPKFGALVVRGDSIVYITP